MFVLLDGQLELLAVYDIEASPTVSYTYTAIVTSGSLSSAASAASNSVATVANGMAWIVDPLNPSGAVGFLMTTNWQPKIKEIGAVYPLLGYPFMVKSTDGTRGLGGTLPIFTSSVSQEQAVEVIIESTDTFFYMTPARGGYYLMTDPATDRQGSVPFPWEATDVPQNAWQVGVYQTTRP
jgi:hypothetical protein